MRVKQKGAVLIVSMIMLLLLTLLAVSSMKTTIMEEKVTGNYKDKNTAFQSAEAALRAGENYLRNTATLPVFDGSNGLYQPTTSGASRWNLVDWSNSDKVVAYAPEDDDESLYGLVEQPNFIIEELLPVIDPDDSSEVGVALENKFYRVTSRAVGGTSTAVIMLQSVFKR